MGVEGFASKEELQVRAKAGFGPDKVSRRRDRALGQSGTFNPVRSKYETELKARSPGCFLMLCVNAADWRPASP